MKDLISREAVKDEFLTRCSFLPEIDKRIGLIILNDIPSADAVEVKHGRWVEFENSIYDEVFYRCSSCGEDFCFIEGSLADNLYKYCPTAVQEWMVIIVKIEMGKTYWKVNNTTETFDTLKETLEKFGLVAVRQKPLGDKYGFQRVIDWETPTGICFSTIWHINLCNIRFGDKWENDLAEIMFDSIQGSYGPFSDHDTIDFVYRGNPMLRLALRMDGEKYA